MLILATTVLVDIHLVTLQVITVINVINSNTTPDVSSVMVLG